MVDNRTPDQALDSALNVDALSAFGYLVRQANEELSTRGWHVWYFIVFKFQGTHREILEYARVELNRVKNWEKRGYNDSTGNT